MLLFAIQEWKLPTTITTFYNAIAALLADNWAVETQERYFRLLREELGAEVLARW